MAEFVILEKDQPCYDYATAHPGDYELPEDSYPQKGIPQGKLIKKTLNHSSVYPGTNRKYWIYVPYQYEPKSEAAFMVFLDGEDEYIKRAHAPVVFDNLIFKGEVPVTIGVFVESGDKGPGYPIYYGEDNRSIEYDSNDSRFAEFLEKDIIPKIKSEYSISDDPDMHGICGMSSGGQAAFAAAFYRPDLFRKVISHCGSFTSIRGGDRMPGLIRKSEKKPLKVFLQTGEHDLNIVFGDWKLANETMASALEYKGYEYKFVEGNGAHSVKHGAALLPETLKWLWAR